MRVNRYQEFMIGGYTPSPKNFDALIFGYYERGKLMYVARTRMDSRLLCAIGPPFSRIGDQDLLVCESARTDGRTMGPGLNDSQDERVAAG